MTADEQKILAALEGVRVELIGAGGELDGMRGDLRRVAALIDRLPTKTWCRRVSIIGGLYITACVGVVWALAIVSFTK